MGGGVVSESFCIAKESKSEKKVFFFFFFFFVFFRFLGGAEKERWRVKGGSDF